MFRLLWECDNFYLSKELFLLAYLTPTRKGPTSSYRELFITSIFHSPVHPHPWTLDDSPQSSAYKCQNNWPLRLSDDTTFTGDLKAFFPDTAAFTDLMNIPSLVFLGQTIIRVYHIIWSSLVLGVGEEAPWMNSFQCKQKLKRVTPNAHLGQ